MWLATRSCLQQLAELPPNSPLGNAYRHQLVVRGYYRYLEQGGDPSQAVAVLEPTSSSEERTSGTPMKSPPQ